MNAVIANRPPAAAHSDAPANAPATEGEWPLRALVDELVATAPDAAQWQVQESGESPWIHVHHAHHRLPMQGWKLHVSASMTGAQEVLRRAMPVLLAAGATFKLARSIRFLATLNQGQGGFSQIGKFITVYPVSDDQAVALAKALHDATQGLHGPSIPSDRALIPGSLVHYRYGGFASRFMQTPLGEILPALVTPEGELIPDRRAARFTPPAWAVDPFAAAGFVPELAAKQSAMIGERYLVLTTLHGSPRGAVHLAFDTVERRSCVLKHARRGGAIDRFNRDARDRLRHEAHILATVAADPRFPRVYGMHEFADDLFLAMEDVAGKTLTAHMNSLTRTGHLPSNREIANMGRQLTSMLGVLHGHGLIFRDLKSTNVIVTATGQLRLIDFELAIHEDSDDSERYGYGTPGFMSPQQYSGERPAVTDDLYALGAILYLLATGAEPGQSVDKTNLLGRPVELVNPAISASLVAIIARCLAPDAPARYASVTELDADLAAAENDLTPALPPARDTEEVARADARARAFRLGETLRALSKPAADGSGTYWRSEHPQTGGFPTADINTGAAGTVLALAELVSELGDPAQRLLLAESARWLLAAPRSEGKPLPGLYVGEGSRAVALLRAGQALGDPALIAAAAERGRSIAALPHASPDLFNGTAGRVRVHLMLHDATGDQIHLDDAIDAGEWLLESAQRTTDGGVTWTMPDGYGTLTGTLGLGYAHGASGVGDVLLDLFEVTGDPRYRDAAAGAARWLARQAAPILPDGSGFGWPDKEGQTPMAGFWCHGAPGIGRFFLHAAQLDLTPDAWSLALGAARTAAHAERAAGPTQCHGLAGNIEYLLDVYQATDDPEWLGKARDLARVLQTFATEVDGNLVYAGDFPGVFSPDYMVGYAGVAVCLLRLADPERLPHQLSRRGTMAQV